MMTEDFQGVEIPSWFLGKYPQYHYSWNSYKPLLSIASRSERKFYSAFKEEELFTDLQKVIVEVEFDSVLTVVLLHECGGVTLVHISKDNITGREPTEWKEVDEVQHDYCYGCSELKQLTNSIKE